MAKIRTHFRFLAFVSILALTFSGFANAETHIYHKGNTSEKKIALTFDDGPSKQNTEAILSILKEYNIKATFFIIGQNAEKDPDRIYRIYEEGHELGNHSYTHRYMTQLSKEETISEVQKTEDILVKITGTKPTVFRPPGGYYNDETCKIIEKMGYQNVLWSIDTRDWKMPEINQIATNVEEKAGAGDIILFHDLEDKRLPTPKALKRIIPFLIENGYEFVSVSEILKNQTG